MMMFMMCGRRGREGTGETLHAKPNYDAVELILPPSNTATDRSIE